MFVDSNPPSTQCLHVNCLTRSTSLTFCCNLGSLELVSSLHGFLPCYDVLQISKLLKSYSCILLHQFYKVSVDSLLNSQLFLHQLNCAVFGSNQLSLESRRYRIGGAKRDRTADPLRARQVLSQLSYSPSVSCFVP